MAQAAPQPQTQADVPIGGAHRSRIKPTQVPLRKRMPLRLSKILKKNIQSITVLLITWSGGSLCLMSFSGMEWMSRRYGVSPHILWGLWTLMLVFLLVWLSAYQFLYYVTYFYDMDQNNFIVRKGIMARREITVPFHKITDVYVDQDILDVMLGLYNIHISTPTVESGSFAHIDGLGRRGAVELRRIILDKINIK